MILKTEYKSDNIIKYTLTDDIDKIDSGVLDDGTPIVNIYRKTRSKDDEFETIRVVGVNLYLMNSDGKTLQIWRSK